MFIGSVIDQATVLGLAESLLSPNGYRGRSQVEDVVARAFCFAGQPHEARAHCKAAIQVHVATTYVMRLVCSGSRRRAERCRGVWFADTGEHLRCRPHCCGK
jgi:hypothetical protein